MLVLERVMPFGQKSLYAAGASYNPQILSEVKEIAQEIKAMFFKFEPMMEDARQVDVLEKVGFKKSAKFIQPQSTIVMDLKKTEEELLVGMHPKTRYNIRVAQKNGVQIRQLENIEEDYEIFWNLLQKTAERDKFFTHEKEYYRVLLSFFGMGDGVESRAACKIFLAEQNGKILAGAIVLFFENQAYYLHGASDYGHRNLMAPYQLHWEIIKEAKKQNYETYDFWGIDEKKWPGVTRFKRGFGGREVNYIGSYDFVLNKISYFFYTLKGKI